MIHKKILDAAESDPSASVQRLAAAVNGASADLVERVLEEYGDPAESEGTTGGSKHDADEEQPHMEHAQTNENADGVDAQGVHEPSDPPTLTVKQREALRAIRASPEATQGELAEQFGVTQSTVNNRLNSIEGFDWKRRRAFAEFALGDESLAEPEAHADASEATVDGAGERAGDDAMKSDGGDAVESERDDADASDTAESDAGDPSDAERPPESKREALARLEELSARVAALEDRLDDASPANVDEPSPLGEPDLACKVVRACFDSPDITEAEEDRILKAVIASGGRT